MPPTAMATPGRTLNVEIEVFNNVDSHPSRRFNLKEPLYQIRVGRGSQNGGKELLPAENNAWFESRVMSRAHAILQADLTTKSVYIEDVGSMHGTYVEERKLLPHTREMLISGDCLRFGAEVTRGPESFPPLEMYISFLWTDEPPQSVPNAPVMAHAEISRNSFSVPDYDDDDDDDEIEIIGESIRAPSVEVIAPPCRYAVPESDLSCAGSFSSDEDESSEPPTPSPRNSRTIIAPWKTGPENVKEKSAEEADSSSTIARERVIALSDAPSAAGFFHFSSEQHPARHQAQSRDKAANESGDGSVRTDASYAYIDAMEDDDLTESDVEFADGSSDDLFDDDDEQSADQGLVAESPPPSGFENSDEESEIHDRGTKEVDSTASEEVLRPCAVCGEDDVRLSATEWKPSEWSDLRSLPFEGIYAPNPTSVKTTFVAEPPGSVKDARAPSPSDAAMAKTTTAQLPPVQSPVRSQSPFLAPMTGDFPRLSGTDAPYAQTSWPTWKEYPADMLYLSSSSHYQEGPFSYQQAGESTNARHLKDRRLAEEASAHDNCTPPKRDQPIDSTRHPTYSIASGTVSKVEQRANTLAPAGLGARKLSIYDIVEKNNQDTSSNGSAPTLKRKADDISTGDDDLARALASSDPEVISEPDRSTQIAGPIQPPESPPITPPNTEAALVAALPTAETAEQPTRKRAKTGVTGYAAAIFAGVIAGGIGTVAALLALPPIQLS